MGETSMQTTATRSRATLRIFAIAAATALLGAPGLASAQQAYPTPEAAADAFTAALGATASMSEVLGSDFKTFVPTEDIDEVHIQAYREAWEKKHSVVPDPDETESGRMLVSVGEGGWTLPLPLVKSDAGWSFDLVAGAEEMRTRRVGRNEIASIRASLAYYDAQREYALRDIDGDGFLEYAQKVISTPGKLDGLYWARLDDEDESPLGPYFGEDGPGSSYHGYLYRILKAQGPSAKGGAHAYVVDGHMRGGFALIAWPVTYDDTGVMTFIVNHRGAVYQTDLGPETTSLVAEIVAFDPGEGWTGVDLKDLEE